MKSNKKYIKINGNINHKNGKETNKTKRTKIEERKRKSKQKTQ